jgi:hypothetical protein
MIIGLFFHSFISYSQTEAGRISTMMFSVSGDTIGFSYHSVVRDTSFIHLRIIVKRTSDSVMHLIDTNIVFKKTDIDSSVAYVQIYYKRYKLIFEAKEVELADIINKHVFDYRYNIKYLGVCNIPDVTTIDSLFSVMGNINIKNKGKKLRLPYTTMLEGSIVNAQRYLPYVGIDVWYCKTNGRYYISMELPRKTLNSNDCSTIRVNYIYLDILI